MNKNGALNTAGSVNNRWRRPRGLAITSRKIRINSSMSKMYLSWAKCERHNNKGGEEFKYHDRFLMLYYEDLTSFLLLVILLELIIFDYESKNWLLPLLPANFELTRRCEEEILFVFSSLRVIVLPFHSTFTRISKQWTEHNMRVCAVKWE